MSRRKKIVVPPRIFYLTRNERLPSSIIASRIGGIVLFDGEQMRLINIEWRDSQIWVCHLIDSANRRVFLRRAVVELSVFDSPDADSVRFALTVDGVPHFERWARSYDSEAPCDDLNAPSYLALRIKHAFFRAKMHDWTSPRPFLAEL